MWWWFPPFQPGVCHRSEQHPRFWLPECHHPDVVYCPFLRENELQDFHRCSKCKAEDAKGCEWMSRESFTFGSRCRRDLVQVIPLRNYLLGYEPPAERKWSSQCWQLLARAFFCWCLVASSFSKARSCPSHHCTTLPEDVQPRNFKGQGAPRVCLWATEARHIQRRETIETQSRCYFQFWYEYVANELYTNLVI